MAEAYRVDGRASCDIPADDRGLAYGDGVFRTLRLIHGQPVAWLFQWQRLDADCRALGLCTPAQDVLLEDLAVVGGPHKQAVAKIMVTRGSGQRGYTPTPGACPRRIVSAHPYRPPAAPDNLALDRSDVVLSYQPQLAGIKHLNRLEQVLARDACRQHKTTDMAMCDSSGRIISTTMRNLVFADSSGCWWTPDLCRAGVIGATRQRLFHARAAHGVAMQAADISWDDLASFPAAMACNSVGNAIAVTRIGRQDLKASRALADKANALLAESE